ncbi:hypothetical protein PENANT_c007G09327 [Penicillium antarcticum]|uniref:ASST-domain-containing protein n=1 Tax=Penicillium antarcticum TaxID=416450 RepID=A0A1V6QCE8_9EURO|nr:uncharacterized protein N7508_003470 [Penicillium antarcticum]KAJ5312640.1 hypothetical protein N7508_003470 [Penicillium antarcticum]OQD86702.1 hypothetical protein PENANT_c007G09327 [Penicillium antarcticum]
MLLLIPLLASLCYAVKPIIPDDDLLSFVSLPDTRALKWDVTHHDRERQAPGYWFVAPYGQITGEASTQKFHQYQVGPYIYDDNGMLIWAGSRQFEDRNVFDFRANTNMDGDTHLSFIVAWDPENEFEDRGRAVILNKHYQVEKDLISPADAHDFNMHEFNILDGGKTAVVCIYRPTLVKLGDFGRPEEESFVVSGGIAEYDIATNDLLFKWNGVDHIPIHESNSFHAWDRPQGSPGWDYVHANAVDKNAAGDYIISMRFTNTIYCVGADGNILWRLGGAESNFDQDFTFSKQHDVKFVESNGTDHVITMLNNASDEASNDEDVSSVLYIKLDTAAMTARLIKRMNRPDGQLTRLRGNAQTLPNGNTFAGWSKFGYQSEHGPDGEVLMTARFVSDRYSTYRAYKSDFVGRPLTPPDVVASVYGTSETSISTVIYVSWNGATDVARWNFYARARESSESVLIGHVEKTDFETMFIVNGYMDYITAEALDRNGDSMSKSAVHRSQIPHNWQAAGFVGSKIPSPQDPRVALAALQHASENSGNDEVDDHTAFSGTVGLFIFFLGVCTLIGGLAAAFFMCYPRRRRSYHKVRPEEDGRLGETHRLATVPE